MGKSQLQELKGLEKESLDYLRPKV